MKFSHLFKALCITALLSPTAFYAMELAVPTQRQIDEANESVALGTWANLNDKDKLVVDKLKMINLDNGKKCLFRQELLRKNYLLRNIPN